MYSMMLKDAGNLNARKGDRGHYVRTVQDMQRKERNGTAIKRQRERGKGEYSKYK